MHLSITWSMFHIIIILRIQLIFDVHSNKSQCHFNYFTFLKASIITNTCHHLSDIQALYKMIISVHMYPCNIFITGCKHPVLNTRKNMSFYIHIWQQYCRQLCCWPIHTKQISGKTFEN